MNYQEIDRYMKETGLAQDPAFVFLHFLTEPIAAAPDRVILGRYYPDAEHDGAGYVPPSTIVLPPDANEDTLLHELGHRHGHYYFDDVSEEYAEAYRKAHRNGSHARSVCSYCSEHDTAERCSSCQHGIDAPVSKMASSPSSGAVTAITGPVFTVVLESPPGTVDQDRRFDLGATLRVRGQLQGAFGIAEVGIKINIAVTNMGLYAAPVTDSQGKFSADLQLPYSATKGDLTLWHEYLLGTGDDMTVIPIGVGMAPDEVKVPKQPGEDFWKSLQEIAKNVAIGAGVLGLVYVAAHVAPSVAKGIKETRRAA